MADRRRPSDGELDLWARATMDVRPRRHAQRISRPLPAAPRRRVRTVATEPGDSDRRQDPGPAVQSMDEKLRRKIRRGRAGIEAKLDLHGHYQAEAYRALSHFIASSRQRGRRLVLVITGKGAPGGEGGVLRRMVPQWLAAPPLNQDVISISQADLRHGGEGALYVRLRADRSPKE